MKNSKTNFVFRRFFIKSDLRYLNYKIRKDINYLIINNFNNMAATSKITWLLKKYARFLLEEELKQFKDHDEETEAMAISCKGAWKLYSGENKDLTLSYLESDHFLLSRQDIIMESFSLPCSDTWLKGVARADSLLMLCQMQDGNIRRFRIQFDEQNGKDGMSNRKECTNLLRKFIAIKDLDINETLKGQEVAELNDALSDTMKLRKGYAINIPKDNLQEMIELCLTDCSFPSYVAKVNEILQSMKTVVK